MGAGIGVGALEMLDNWKVNRSTIANVAESIYSLLGAPVKNTVMSTFHFIWVYIVIIIVMILVRFSKSRLCSMRVRNLFSSEDESTSPSCIFPNILVVSPNPCKAMRSENGQNKSTSNEARDLSGLTDLGQFSVWNVEFVLYHSIVHGCLWNYFSRAVSPWCM